MRRDLVYFYPVPLKPVYDACFNAANQKFGKNCKADPFKSLQFGLDFSFKYNMNGGSVTAHFMPYQNGTAINLRYTIIQALGARYKKHAQDYMMYVDGLLNVRGALIGLDVQQFMDYEANTPSGVLPQQAPPQQMPPQQVPPQQTANGMVCPNCGSLADPGSNFCTKCGSRLG
jgi:hypothetical protein